MPYDMRIISSTDFLRLDAEGHLDMSASRRLLADVMWVSVQSGIRHILIDVREATCEMTAAQLATLAEACRDLRPTGPEYRVALLNRPKDHFDRAALAASWDQAEGRNTKAFRSFEDAFNWLTS
jgi:hypothetical protein